jgi:hypothetical protein
MIPGAAATSDRATPPIDVFALDGLIRDTASGNG